MSVFSLIEVACCFAMTSLIWLATLLLSVSFLRKLLIGGYGGLGVIQKLLCINWVRTGLWSLRSIVFLYFYFKE